MSSIILAEFLSPDGSSFAVAKAPSEPLGFSQCVAGQWHECGLRREKVLLLPLHTSCVTLSKPTFLSLSFFIYKVDFTSTLSQKNSTA